MPKGFYHVPLPKNEPVLNYAPGSKERALLKKALEEARSQVLDIPMYIGEEEVRSGKKIKLSPPHDHHHVLGYYHQGDKSHVEQAVQASLAAKELWVNLGWEHRASIFLKAAELLAGPWRYKINAATMLGQSKSAYQAEIDSACELIDFLRFNVYFMSQIYQDQPESSPGVWNRIEYRPLEGFTFALTPFNFTAIAGNLPSSMALMGNTVVWKPANSQIYAAQVIMRVFKLAGLPDGVINLVYADGPTVGGVIFNHRDFAGLHFTGSTGVFQNMWKTIGQNIHLYKSYPRIVGETGGKDFIMVHKSANAREVATAMVRGAFEYQGQKCSAASRCYIPSNLWEEVKKYVLEDLKSFKIGGTEDFGNFFNAVIDENAFHSITGYIEKVRNDGMNEIIAGGKYDKSKGYFIDPTVVVTKDPLSLTMCEEVFGPVLTVYVYHAENFEQTLELVDSTSPYALTGSIFSGDRFAIEMATKKLSNAAGNFYINDKPTGAVVGQQPFGGARGSGTNDKAGAKVNLLRWVSLRTIKETFVPAVDYRYPFLEKD
ncbi:MAG: L-glutamate gamma-semialdehyde dehydrogenase [Cyclobacteriaceae bacterium]